MLHIKVRVGSEESRANLGDLLDYGSLWVSAEKYILAFENELWTHA